VVWCGTACGSSPGDTEVSAAGRPDNLDLSPCETCADAGALPPVVFFAAHPDDETIGMAGAIRQARSEGRPVFVELMTHGEASAVRPSLSNGQTDPWHEGKHVYRLSVQEFGDARVNEFLDAMGRLDVTRVHVADFRNGKLTPADVQTRIAYWISQDLPGLSLRGTAGAQDPAYSNGAPHPDHAAVWRALVDSRYPDILGYCIYEAVSGKCRYDAAIDVSRFCQDKRYALAAYETWNPTLGRYAIAFHSTHDLLQNVGATCVEYVVRPAHKATFDDDDDRGEGDTPEL
jgi:LmbE family N-acetylglucosaminyl deacetylase